MLSDSLCVLLAEFLVAICYVIFFVLKVIV